MPRIRVATATILVAACSGRGRQLAPIRLEPLASFGTGNGDGAIATDPSVSARHPSGFRIVIPGAGAGGITTQPLVYNDSGRFLGTLNGGTAAAEQFQVPLFARIGPADSIWIFDGSQRVLIFGPNREYGRTAQLPETPWDAVVLPDGRMLIAPANADRPLPLLLLSQTGKLIREYGAHDSTAAAIHSPRWLIRDPDGSFWSMPMQFRWRLEHWDSGGAPFSVLERRPDWFAPYDQVSTPDRNHAPQPTVQGAWIDTIGRFWVLGRVADQHWDRGLSSHRPGTPGSVIVDPDKVYDTELEAIDRRTGKLTAAARLDPSYASVVEPGVIMRVIQIAGGWKRAVLVNVVFEANTAVAGDTNSRGRRD
jgi:hypothetical protein